MGSWTFVFAALLFLAAWTAVNVAMQRAGHHAFDKYPFILLNLLLSCLAAMQGAILLIAARRADQISSELAAHDYEVDRRAEQLIEENTSSREQSRSSRRRSTHGSAGSVNHLRRPCLFHSRRDGLCCPRALVRPRGCGPAPRGSRPVRDRDGAPASQTSWRRDRRPGSKEETPRVNVLLRATEIEGRPVVTLGGERVGDVKDVLFDSSQGRLLGFTLRSHRFFSGPRTDVLPWSNVGTLGRDAVMIRGEAALEAEETLAAEGLADHRNVVGNQVLTDAGTDLGTVIDVIIETGAVAQIVGYEVAASDALATKGEHVLIPLPDTIAVSSRHLMVPEAALEFVSNDLSGFGAAVEGFRAKLRARLS